MIKAENKPIVTDPQEFSYLGAMITSAAVATNPQQLARYYQQQTVSNPRVAPHQQTQLDINPDKRGPALIMQGASAGGVNQSFPMSQLASPVGGAQAAISLYDHFRAGGMPSVETPTVVSSTPSTTTAAASAIQYVRREGDAAASYSMGPTAATSNSAYGSAIRPTHNGPTTNSTTAQAHGFGQQIVMRPTLSGQSAAMTNGVLTRPAASSPGPGAPLNTVPKVVAKSSKEVSVPVKGGKAVGGGDSTGAAPSVPYPIQVGETLPPAQIDLHGVYVNLREFFEDRTGVLFGLLGAYHPVDTKVVVPAILSHTEDFQRLVDFVGCLVVNDPFVVKAWARKLNVADQCTFIADSDAKFTQALGMETYLPEEGFGLRCRRFAMIVGSKARVRWIAFDDDASADNVIRHLPFHVRTPWKSFLVGISHLGANNEESGGNMSVVPCLETVRMILSQQGYCSESDWQLILSNEIEGAYEPTRGNIISGLKWLVEGAQSGDSLFFYFCGRGAQLCDILEEGFDGAAILPIDYEKNGVIDECTIYEVIAPNVCEGCRISLMFDCTGIGNSPCRMPYATVRSPENGKSDVIQVRNRSWKDMVDAMGIELAKPPAGEIFVISAVSPGPNGGGREEPGMLVASMMVTRPPPKEVQARFGGDGDQESTKECIVQENSYKDKLVAMEDYMRTQGTYKNVVFESSVPFLLEEEFSFADILFKAKSQEAVN